MKRRFHLERAGRLRRGHLSLQIAAELEWQVATVIQQRGWDINSVAREQKTERERNRAIRARQRAIGRELRRMYDDVVREQVPAEMLEMLLKIDDLGEDGSGRGGDLDS
jgi:uncharacterized protein YnzC (UPF0291/DUF896 family)